MWHQKNRRNQPEPQQNQVTHQHLSTPPGGWQRNCCQFCQWFHVLWQITRLTPKFFFLNCSAFISTTSENWSHKSNFINKNFLYSVIFRSDSIKTFSWKEKYVYAWTFMLCCLLEKLKQNILEANFLGTALTDWCWSRQHKSPACEKTLFDYVLIKQAVLWSSKF